MDEPLDRLRAICLALPRVEEKLSHGSPCWFLQKGRQFAAFVGCLHGDPRPSFWVAAPAGAQEALIGSNPEVFFRPPYVGVRGWVGVYVDGELDWDDLASIVEEGWRTVAPRAVRSLDRPFNG